MQWDRSTLFAGKSASVAGNKGFISVSLSVAFFGVWPEVIMYIISIDPERLCV